VDNNLLFFDLRVDGIRCREQTLLPDNKANRKKLQVILDQIESEIAAGTFVYANYFPGSKALKRLAKLGHGNQAKTETTVASEQVVKCLAEVSVAAGPLFKDFAKTWFDERSIEWRRSHIKSLLSTMNGHLVPHFGEKVVGNITKSEVLEFRAQLGKVKGRGDMSGLSPKRINEIMGLLRQIINEAADRFEFTSPLLNIKKLRQRKTDVEPFSLGDVSAFWPASDLWVFRPIVTSDSGLS